MTTIDPQALRHELLLKQAIDDRLDEIVRQAVKAVVLLRNNESMEVSQLRNLLNVAVETGSLEVVVNFIRYQIARNSRAWGAGPNDFGHHVIADLRGPVKKLADETLAQVRARSADLAGDDMRDVAYRRLMRLYLGYLNRTFYYARRTKDFGRLLEDTNA